MELIAKTKIMSFISELAASARDVESRIHIAAVSTLDHIREHGDSTGAAALLNTLPKGQRVQGLAAWYRHFSNGKMTVKQNADKVWSIALKERTDADFDMAGAEQTTFAELTNEAAPKQLDVAKFVASLERVSTNDAEIVVDGKATPKVAPAARALAAKMVAFYRESLAQAAA